MPALYFNSEVGSCATEEHALHCISRTLSAYEGIKKHISSLCQEQEAFAKMKLCSEKDKGSFISEFVHKVDKKTRMQLVILLHDISKGSVFCPPDAHTKTLKFLDIPSPLLEYVLTQNGMTLSFATDAYWENDFIEFNECVAAIPNVWGQTDFSSFAAWLKEHKKQKTTFFLQILQDFNVEFCNNGINENSFSLQEWRMIYSSFQKANLNNFEIAPPLIKRWGTSPIYYIRDKNHSNFTIRIFFIKKDNKIHVGEIYHKNESNTLKEERAADSSYRRFFDLGLLE